MMLHIVLPIYQSPKTTNTDHAEQQRSSYRNNMVGWIGSLIKKDTAIEEQFLGCLRINQLSIPKLIPTKTNESSGPAGNELGDNSELITDNQITTYN